MHSPYQKNLQCFPDVSVPHFSSHAISWFTRRPFAYSTFYIGNISDPFLVSFGIPPLSVCLLLNHSICLSPFLPYHTSCQNHHSANHTKQISHSATFTGLCRILRFHYSFIGNDQFLFRCINADLSCQNDFPSASGEITIA